MPKNKKKHTLKNTQKKKQIAINKKSMLKQAEEIVAKNPKEFIIGFIVISILFVFSTASAGYLFLRSGMPVSIRNPQKQPAQTEQKIPSKDKKTTKIEYYVLQENESLWDVANKVYGNPYLYTKIVKLNGLSNPDLVEKGMRLRIR